ncbi:hypothetical protein [Peribacillus frigoritolerans]|uniref:hypothetical protein n=1 Tax=Peribacillus frigoritolerans TaxID=450367 RepID=UPI00363F3C0F
MGRNTMPASQVTGNHLSKTEIKHLIELEKEIAGKSDRLEIGLNGLHKQELNQLINQNAKLNYHILALEAHESSALANIHISTLIDLANEMENLKRYEKAIKVHGVLMFLGEKPLPNPAVKMRQDSLKSINVMKSQLDLGAVDIATLARKRAEMNETDSLDKLLGDGGSDEDWEEKTNEI